MKHICSAVRALCIAAALITLCAEANQAATRKRKRAIANLENIAAIALAPQILSAIANMPATQEDPIPAHIPTAERVMAQLTKLNIPQATYTPLIYHTLHSFTRSPRTTPEEKRIAIMELLPLVERYSSKPKSTKPLLFNEIDSLSYLPYDSSVGPWLMNFMEQMSPYLSRPQADTKDVILRLLFTNNAWMRSDKLDFITNIGKWVEAKEITAQINTPTTEMQNTNVALKIFGSSSKNMLQMLKEALVKDISGDTTFDWSTKFVFNDREFSYPVFIITLANDAAALAALVKASDKKFLEAIDFTNSENMNALTVAARSEGLQAITEALLRNGATISALYTSPDDNQQQVLYDALAEATERNDSAKVKAMLTLASDRIDDDILENAQEIAITNDNNHIMQLIDAEIHARQQEE